MDITSIFYEWTGSIISNNGLIVMRPTEQEDDSTKYGSISFYSMDTHTVYLPTLEVVYDSHTYDSSSFYIWDATGSVLSGSVSGSLISGSVGVYLKNLMPTYNYDSTVRFNLTIKNAYQVKTFFENVHTSEILYISDNLYYSIRDVYSNRIMVPFSDYTKVSLDETGHFFDVSLSGFMPERFYKIIFKYTENGVEQYFDTDNQFKIVK